jgi:dihydroxy-acid dehydratase
MSGTAFGTVVLHVVPEAEAGGPLAVVRNGDEILLDAPNRRLELMVAPAELAARIAAWQRHRPPLKQTRGYQQLYVKHVMQADQGCDLDFLTGASGSVVDRESH